MSIDSKTIETYDAKAQEYVNLFSTDRPSRQLRDFIAALPKGGKALDLGCGPGNSAAMMRDAGLQVAAIDASPKMVELGREKYGLDIRLGSFDDVTETAVYDGIWASFSLLHAPRADMPRHLSAIHKALKPNGILMLGMKTGTGEKRDHLGRMYTYYSRENLDNLLQTAGFTPASHFEGSEMGLAGDVEPFIIITANA
jgi:SAM-dependent methyltransferase